MIVVSFNYVHHGIDNCFTYQRTATIVVRSQKTHTQDKSIVRAHDRTTITMIDVYWFEPTVSLGLLSRLSSTCVMEQRLFMNTAASPPKSTRCAACLLQYIHLQKMSNRHRRCFKNEKFHRISSNLEEEKTYERYDCIDEERLCNTIILWIKNLMRLIC